MLGRVIQDRLLAAPERVASRFLSAGGETVLTQSGLCGMASDAARRVAALDLAPRSVVGIAQYSGAALHAAWLGVLWAGHIPAMLAPPSPRMEAAKYASGLAGIVSALALGALLVDAASGAGLGHLSGTTRLVAMEDLDPQAAVFEAADIAASEIAALQHSSGTTGQQKAIALTAAEILAHQAALGSRLGLGEADKIVSWLPLYHDMGFVAAFLQPLLTGIELVELSPFEWASRPAMLLEAIAAHRPTLCWMPNFAFALLAEPRVLRSLGEIDLSSVRMWINCSEPVMATSIDRFAAALAARGVAPAALAASYAMAENVFAVTQSAAGGLRRLTVDREQLETAGRIVEVSPEDARSAVLVSNGPVIPTTQVEVRDAHGRPLGEAMIGEFHLRGEHRFAGYHGRADLTAAAIDGNGWYATGDLGFVLDNEVYVTGRQKDLLILRGRNYLAQDIEASLGALAGVRPGRVVAFSLPDPQLGTERLIVIAEAEPGADNGALALAIRQCVAQTFDTTIGDLKIVPERWLVKSTSGKLARKDNAAKYLREWGN